MQDDPYYYLLNMQSGFSYKELRDRLRGSLKGYIGGRFTFRRLKIERVLIGTPWIGRG